MDSQQSRYRPIGAEARGIVHVLITARNNKRWSHNMNAREITRQDLRNAAEKYKNWGKWGPDDEIGTLNYTTPEDIIAASRLVKKGKVISLALNFDYTGPQGAKSKYP